MNTHLFSITGSTAGDQTEKSPSDEGFTELEPTVNGSTEEAEGAPSREPEEGSGSGRSNREDKSMLGQTGKAEDEEDEGVAQNSSIEDGESIHSNLEKQGEIREGTLTKEELQNRVDDKIIRKLTLQETSGIQGRPRQSKEGERLGEEDKPKKSEDSEMRSWLMEKIQAPIEGECHMIVTAPPAAASASPSLLCADMLFSSEERSKNPPMFLCFKVGKPMRKSFAAGRTSSPAHSLGSWGRQPEYWFAVPQER